MILNVFYHLYFYYMQENVTCKKLFIMPNQLYDHIVKLIPTFEKEVGKVLSYFEKQSFPKDYILIKEGNMVDEFYFVLKGCLQIYFTDASGSKNTIHFAIENWWVTEYTAFLGAAAAHFTIAALEETEVLVIKKEKFDEMLFDFPFMAIYFNKIHMRAYGAALQKQKTYAVTSKKDFHHYFCTHYPDLVKRFPDDVFASYIGISTEELAILNENLRS